MNCFFCQIPLNPNNTYNPTSYGDTGIACKYCPLQYQVKEVSTFFNDKQEQTWVLIIHQFNKSKLLIWINIQENFINVFNDRGSGILHIPKISPPLNIPILKNKILTLLTFL